MSRAFNSATSGARRFSVGIGTLVKSAVVFDLVRRGMNAVSGSLHSGIDEWKQQTLVAAQTAQVLKTTHGVANVTAKAVDNLARSQMLKTGIDDEAIKTTENLLLGYTNIHNEVGRGNDIFDRATKVVTDYSVRTGKNASAASIMLGKALQDPIHGLGGLAKAGITFTDVQKKLIKGWVEHGNIAKAQNLIVGQMEKRFGGAAEAAGKTLPGKLRILREEWRNLSGDLVGIVVPAFTSAVTAAVDFTRKISNAKGFRAKLDVVWDTAKDATSSIQGALQRAVAAVDWTAVWNKATGIASGIEQRFESIDWGGVGTKIGDGISGAVTFAIKNTKGLPTALKGMFDSIDWVALGRKAGPGIVAALASAIATALDPAFWIKNWDLALAIGVAFFGKGLGKIAGKLAVPLSRVFGDAVIATAAVIERLSPRLATAFLSGVLKLPGLLGGVFGRLETVVSRAFGRLGGLARFTIKVLGLEAAINGVVAFAHKVKEWLDRVVNWFKELPGRIIGAIPSPGSMLVGIGAAIMGGLWHGIQSGWDTAKGGLHKITSLIPHIKGPESKDAQLLVANGRAIMLGLLRGMESGWQDNEKMLGKVASRIQAAMNRLQAQLDSGQRRQEDQSNQAALADAEKQLAAARKSGKNIADAERAVQTALQQIRDTAAQRELDRLTKQHDKILAKLDRLKQRTADKLQKLKDVAGAAFDDLSAKIQRAFDANNSAFVSPAQQQINSILGAQQQQDLERAVTDAQAALADASANGGDVFAAQQALQRAQSDLLINGQGGLQDQANAQQKGHDQEVDAQQEALDKLLSKLRTKLAEQGTVYGDGITDILAIIKGYDGDFETVGGLLGEKFLKGLRDAMNNAAGAGAAVKGGGSTMSGAAGMAALRGGTTEINVHLPNYLGNERDVAGTIRDEILRIQGRNVSAF